MSTTSEQPLLIGELARRAEVNRKTIRYYEQLGLLPAPSRTASGYRRYQAADAERVRFIKAAQRLGFSLGEINEILALRDRGQPPCSHVATLLERHARDIDAQLTQLQLLRRELHQLSARARQLATSAPGPTDPASTGYCHILEHPPDTTPASTVKAQ